jgi:hypothetical protein
MFDLQMEFAAEFDLATDIPLFSEVGLRVIWTGAPIGEKLDESEGLPTVWEVPDGYVCGYQYESERDAMRRCVVFVDHPVKDVTAARRHAVELTQRACT